MEKIINVKNVYENAKGNFEKFLFPSPSKQAR